jgi:hypothetical protein
MSSTAPPAALRGARLARWLRPFAPWIWRLLAAVGLTLLVATTTARLTLLDTDFDADAIGSVDGYERASTEVLPSPAVQNALAQGLAGLPIDASYLTANARVLVPPSVLEAVVRAVVADYVDVVMGKASGIDVSDALQPVVDHVVRLARQLAPGAVVTAPRLHPGSLDAFDTAARSVLSRLASGDLDVQLPTLTVRPADVDRVASILTAGLPVERQAEIRPQLERFLASGDLDGAFATIVPAYLDDAAVQRIALRTEAQLRDALASIASPRALSSPEPVLPLGLGWLTLIGAVLSLAIVRPITRAPRRTLRELAWTFGLATILAILAAVALRHSLVDPLRDLIGSHELNPPTRQLVLDIDDELRRGVQEVYLRLVGVLVALGLVAAVVPVAVRMHDRRTGRVVATASTAALGAAAFLAAAYSAPAPPVCNGSPTLCDRPYNDVVYLTSHNAMASSDRGFIDASQDTDLIGQLDNGVRGLMLDLHYWTTPAEAAPYLERLDPATRAALGPLIDTFEPRPGVWLCHQLCQLGADPAVDQLSRLRDWLDANPNEVVTLILEDDVRPDDVTATIKDAGLDDRLATPPARGEPWPTLQALIDDQHTLFVFTQSARLTDGPIRNFYELAAETPYAAARPADLSCDQGRGHALAPLFLVNNWISGGVPTRTAALQVNAPGFLLPRVQACERQRGMRANFIAVDFAQIGDPLSVVTALNALIPLSW